MWLVSISELRVLLLRDAIHNPAFADKWLRCFNLRIESLVIESPSPRTQGKAVCRFNLRIESLVIERLFDRFEFQKGVRVSISELRVLLLRVGKLPCHQS